jgi:tol-pal system protein YbgF
MNPFFVGKEHIVKRLSILLFVVLVLTTSFTFAGKDDVNVSTLGQEIATIKTAVDNHGTSLAGMKNQVDEVVTTVQTINGDVGKSFKAIRDQSSLVKDLQTRVQVLEDQISLLTGQLQELKTEGLLAVKTSQRLDEFKAYSKAVEYINAKQFDKATTELQGFQKTFPKSIFNSYAQYWIGESYYRQQDYQMAIMQYEKLVKSNPQSAKAPAAMYRQGLSFYYLQSFNDAKDFFTKVIRNYPQTIEAVQSSSQIARINSILNLKKQEEFEHDMVN